MKELAIDETIKRSAYSSAMKYKRAGLDDELIYVRLEKQGFPQDLIHHVIKNLNIEQRKKPDPTLQTKYEKQLIILGATSVVAVIIAFAFPDHTYLPFGTIIAGIVSLLNIKKKMDKQ